ncbi:hypothetical protein N9883_00760 [Flavobacteriaceae bacterium]|nr:hypothetical protein [Flavobacteriaceae bacterium]
MKKFALVFALFALVGCTVSDDELLEENIDDVNWLFAPIDKTLTINDIIGDWQVKTISSRYNGESNPLICDNKTESVEITKDTLSFNEWFWVYELTKCDFQNIKFSYKGLNQSGVYAMETKTIFTEQVREYDLTILSKNVFRLNAKIEHSLLGFDSLERIFFRK